MKLLKDIRDSLRGGARPPSPDNNDNNDNNDDDNDDKEFVSPLLEEINIKKYTNYDEENNDKIIKKEKEYNEIFSKYNESIKELEKTKDELNKEKGNNQLKKIKKKFNDQNDIVK